jgi:N-acetylneuraminic acid mutarotase
LRVFWWVFKGLIWYFCGFSKFSNILGETTCQNRMVFDHIMNFLKLDVLWKKNMPMWQEQQQKQWKSKILNLLYTEEIIVWNSHESRARKLTRDMCYPHTKSWKKTTELRVNVIYFHSFHTKSRVLLIRTPITRKQ